MEWLVASGKILLQIAKVFTGDKTDKVIDKILDLGEVVCTNSFSKV